MTTAGLNDQQRLADTGGTGDTNDSPATNKYRHHSTHHNSHQIGGQRQATDATLVSSHNQDKKTKQQPTITSTTPIPTTKGRNIPVGSHGGQTTNSISANSMVQQPEEHNRTLAHRNNFNPDKRVDIEFGDKMANGHFSRELAADEGSSEEELMTVASAEEYAAKITKLQQACLIPLKEDLADWLNKILKTSNMTTENFMHNLDNGVIICRLAKIISLWCEQQFTSDTRTITNSISTSSTNIHTSINDKKNDVNCHQHTSQFHYGRCRLANSNGPLRSTTSQSINCLASSVSVTSLNDSAHTHRHPNNQFLNNLIEMHQTKIWEDAKCRTFYARDNVCHFLKWSKDFGVNQSVLFESDDLVLHANPRQVVLCLLDVARIAYVKYGFTEAPGLVKFEQEMNEEIQASKKNPRANDDLDLADSAYLHRPTSGETCGGRSSGSNLRSKDDDNILTSKQPLDVPIDATDKLVLRYCRHKEKEAARRKTEELAAEAASLAASSLLVQADVVEKQNENQADESKLDSRQTDTRHTSGPKEIAIEHDNAKTSRQQETELQMSSCAIDPVTDCDAKSAHSSAIDGPEDDDDIIVSSTSDSRPSATKHLAESGRVDSLDSGKGPTESASTGHSSSRSMTENSVSIRKGSQGANHTSIPVPIKRNNYNSTPSHVSNRTDSSMNSELSSSRSSLLSNPDGNTSNYESQATSDLDGKVMKIAKSYYGKKATRDVTRLSEGKYRIADRIVFVRLLKGHRVMVRIGGGWDTLENFLLRHKSDPSQVIDPDNLLPLETKMPFDKTPQATPTKSASKLPYYRLSSSVSSNNLSLANLAASNQSLITSTTQIGNHVYCRNGDTTSKMSPITTDLRVRQISHQNLNAYNNSIRGKSSKYLTTDSSPSHSNLQKSRAFQTSSTNMSPSNSSIRRQFNYHKTPHSTGKYISHRPLASTMAPTASATNIHHLYDSSARSQATRRDRGPNQRLILK